MFGRELDKETQSFIIPTITEAHQVIYIQKNRGKVVAFSFGSQRDSEEWDVSFGRKPKQTGRTSQSSGDNATSAGVLKLSDVKAIAAGSVHCISLKEDGTVWTWGGDDNAFRTIGRSLTSVHVRGLTDIAAINVGYCYSLAVKQNGTVLAWGANSAGQLGNGTRCKNCPVPAQVEGLSGVVALAAGRVFSLALKRDGTVWAWGSNVSGQLGDGTKTGSNVPVQVGSSD